MHTASADPAFDVRLVCVEHYQTSPIPSLDPVYSEFRGAEIKHVPVIRIFGSTPNGEKACVHIHGVFPYLYVPYIGGENRDALGYRLATSLDAAINISLGSAAARSQHVFKVQPVSGIPFYGYHEREHQYFKIYFYNPSMVRRAANLLQNGTVLNVSLQPHEAHIPYIQQFMIDYNLHGMSLVHLRRIVSRLPSEGDSAIHARNTSPLSPYTDSSDYLPNGVQRQSTCKIEVDAVASDILNRAEIEGELVLNPGLAAIWQEETARRRQLGLRGGVSQLVRPSSPDRPPFKPTHSDMYQRERLAKRLSTISQSADNSMSRTPQKNTSSYPLEIDDSANFINASCLEHHVSLRGCVDHTVLTKPQYDARTSPTDVGQILIGLPPESRSQSLDCSVLDVADNPLLDMLFSLADENIGGSTVDGDSVLGSQCSDSDIWDSCDSRDDENADMNLTLLQLDSLSRSQCDKSLPGSWGSRSELPKVGGTAAYHDDLHDLSVFDVDTDDSSGDGSTRKSYISKDGTSAGTDQILGLDGPVDQSSEDSDLEPDAATDRPELRICDYRPSGGCNQQSKEHIVSIASGKLKHGCEADISTASETLGKHREHVSLSRLRNLCQTPKKFSPVTVSSPGGRQARNYSPLGIIVGSASKILANNDDSTCKERVERLRNKQEALPHKISVNVRKHGRADSEDARDIAFATYLDTQSKQSLDNVSLRNSIDASSIGTDKEIVIVPQYKPPSFHRVADRMEQYGITMYVNENPYFSNHTDAMNRKEVAHKLLRVPSKCVAALPRFESRIGSTAGIKQWQAMKLKTVYPSVGDDIAETKVRQSLTSQSTIVIVPLVAVPLPLTVRLWSKAKLSRNKMRFTKCLADVGVTKEIPRRYSTLSELENHVQSTAKFIHPSNEDHSHPSSCNSAADINESPTNSDHISSSRKEIEASRQLGISCGQIEGSSQTDHFKIPCENLQDIKPLATHQYLTVLCMEVHVSTRGDLLPDPQHDAIRAIFYAIHNDVPATSNQKSLDYGVLAYDPMWDGGKLSGYLKRSDTVCSVSFADTENALFDNFLSIISESDPDILIGWELESLSWGYLFQRAESIGINLSPKVSRVPSVQQNWETQTSELSILTEIKMPGRIVLDIWRIMRQEIALQSYTFENVMYHVMHQRLSCPSFATLTHWWDHQAPRSRSMVVEHYIAKVVGILKVIDHLDIIGKTTEFARLYGIQFFEVYSRGSQFQVESVMLRLAKPSNYVPVSPSPQQRASMRAPESLPLIMEPESVYYSDPLIVLDFQSLYPSIVIAHNYCFSTCLGRVENIGQSVPFEFGATSLRVTGCTARKLEDKLNFSPSGVAFVKPEVRVGILPRMLTEYLETRLMVKKAMTDHSSSGTALQRALHSRQRGLKLLANVTFGYTHANFSGRMPCIEIGDSIVSKARETLERAIKLVEANKGWNARVVYGDTDSLFVLLPGRSRIQAFQVGAEIASAVTRANPKPIKLKLEKIMQPSILQTKKRYCGYMYESVDQEKPVYLAKGIETVRRDGCPAVSKILERSLRILFDTCDVSEVKRYVTRQLDKVLRGRVSLQDLTFAKEFRGLQGYKSTARVPALELTRRLMTKDPRAIPRTSERVPYLIVAGAPNQPLFQCVRSPKELIADIGLRPNTLYYTTRVIIPPLNRCLNLIGVDVNSWFEDMPHRQATNSNPSGMLRAEAQRSTISQYFGTVACVACGCASNAGICGECCRLPNFTIALLHEKIRQLERAGANIGTICRSCIGRAGNIDCMSLDCPVLYRRFQSIREQDQISYIRQIIEKGSSLEL